MSQAPEAPLLRLPAWAGPAVVAVTGCLMLWWSWGTWPDILVDFGREVYTPWQLTRGKVLYKDVASFYGPLSPYLNSIWMRLFGVSLRSVVLANIFIGAALTWMLYKVLIVIGGRLSAVTGGLVFVSIFACSRLNDMGNFNFITPYSHELTHGVFLSVAAILCFRRYLTYRSHAALAATGALLGLTFLTKPEVFAAIAGAIVVGTMADAWLARQHPSLVLRAIVMLVAAALLPVTLAAALFALAMPLPQAAAAVVSPWKPIIDPALRDALTSLRFYRMVLGSLEAPGRIVLLVLWMFWYIAMLGPAHLIARRKLLPRFSASRSAAVVMFVLVVFGSTLAFGISPYWPWAASPLPVFISAWIGVLLISTVRRRHDDVRPERLTVMFAWATFSLIMLWKMVLAASFAHYGFALAMPATLGLIALIVDVIPDRILRGGGSPIVFRAAVAGLLIAFIGASLATNYRHFQIQSRLIVGRGPDMFLSDARAPVVNEALADIEHRLSPSETLLVVPEGVMLNYLSRRNNPTPFINFMPPELLIFGESEIVGTLRRSPPDYVMVVDKDTSEYGAYFGSDPSRRLATRHGSLELPSYGASINHWIEAEYEPIALFGHEPLRDGRFGLKLMKRRDFPSTAQR